MMTPDGLFDYERAMAANAASQNGSQVIFTNAVNDHDWYGMLSSYKNHLTENLTLTGGVDLRYYKGYHTEEIDDLLGGEFYLQTSPLAFQTKNQLLKMPSFAGSPYKYYYVNAGNIQNEGVELTLGVTPVMTNDFRWKTSFNFSTNKNKIVKLHEDLKEMIYGPTSFSSSYAMKLIKGGSIGDIYGKAFVRDDAGNIVYETEGDNKGLPLVEGDGNTVKVGNANPVFMMGWDHTFSYKGFTLYFLLDWRYGGEVLSQTQAEMDLYGVSEITADARDRGYVMLDGQRIDDVKGFYKIVGGRAGVTEYYMYDATNLRLREVSLSYNFSRRWIQKTKVLKDVQLSFVARNLCFLYKKAPFDPDLVLSTGNDNQGIEVFGMPTTRSLGFTLKCEF